MSAQDNLKLSQTVYKLFSEGKLEQAVTLANDDVEATLIPFGMTFKGREGFMQFMGGYKSAFPDITINIKNQVATDDQVVTEFTARGKHDGPLMTPNGPIPPTGREVEFVVCEVWKVKNGKLASIHNYYDNAGIMRQLGLIN